MEDVMEPKDDLEMKDGYILVVLDKTGDTKLSWDPAQPAEVTHARDTFEKFKAKGYLAYSVMHGGGQGTVLKSFDPSIKRMILAPPQVGG